MSTNRYLSMFTPVLGWLLLFSHSVTVCTGSEAENKLLDALFMDEGLYNPAIRPVKNVSDVIKVNVKFTLVQILHVDEKSQLMKTNIWLDMYWNDTEISWDPAEFEMIDSLRVSPDKVWMPEVVLINNADGKFKVSFDPKVVIKSTGAMQWMPPSIYKSSCEIDMTFFPFDKQNCTMKFASWTYNAEEVELGILEIDFSSVYGPSNLWYLETVFSEIKKESDATNAKNISTMTFTLNLKRRTLYYTINLLIPCVLISSFSTWVFYLPANFLTKKITMCVCILLALMFFLTLIYRLTPPTSTSIPLITKYLLFTFIMHIVAITGCVIVLNWNFRTPRTHAMPRWVRLVFLNYLPRLLLMARPTPEEQQQERRHYWLFKQQANLSSRRILPGGTTYPGHQMTKSATSSFVINSSTESDFGCPVTTGCHGATDRRHDASGGAVSGERLGASRMMGNSGSSAGGSLTALSPGVTSAAAWPASYTADQSSAFHQRESYGMSKAIDAIRFIAAHLKNEEDYGEVLDDWHYISLVLDRLHFVVFLVVTAIGVFGFLVLPNFPFDFSSSSPTNTDSV